MCIMNDPGPMKPLGAGLVTRHEVPPTIQYIPLLALKHSVDSPFWLAVEDVYIIQLSVVGHRNNLCIILCKYSPPEIR